MSEGEAAQRSRCLQLAEAGEVRFSEDQPRDERGRFGGGSSTTAYHGSPNKFNTFKVGGGEEAKYGPGAYLTTNKATATNFAKASGGNVYTVGVAHAQPYDTNKPLSGEHVDKINAAAKELGLNGIPAGATHGSQAYKYLATYNGGSKVAANKILGKAGFDGIIGSDGEMTTFDASKIKIRKVEKA